MFELIPVTERTYYIQSPTNVGLYRLDEERVCLIDSGSDRDAGRRIRKILDEHGWKLAAIYNTHAHADHTGGSRYLQAQTGCRVFVPADECVIARRPLLGPSMLWGGYPVSELQHKFLVAAECDAEPLSDDALPAGFTRLPLPGHSPEMTGFRTPDDIVFLGDSLSGRKTLEKYHIVFFYDAAAYLRSLEAVEQMEAVRFIPAHAEATAHIAALARENIESVYRIAETICALCETPLTFEALLQKLFTKYDIPADFTQYALVGSTVRSYLSWLKETGRIAAAFTDGFLRWQTVPAQPPEA